jgi:hypothetical protein
MPSVRDVGTIAAYSLRRAGSNLLRAGRKISR